MVFSFTGGGYTTHLLVRLDLDSLSACGPLSAQSWNFSQGWQPALVENAREIMYMGDQIVTSTGLNDQFRVYWIFDDDTTVYSVDRTIAPYLFTDRFSAHCPVPGGFNPCVGDQQIVGAVVEHNTPLPGNLGAAGDKIDFYWGVREGNGFTLPYTESAGFHGNTIAYIQRKVAYGGNFTPWYCAAGANDRGHAALVCQLFFPVASGIHPQMHFAMDDDFNGSAHLVGWEFWTSAGLMSTGAWTSNSATDYLRVRSHNPVGVAWVASGYRRNQASAQYRPLFFVFGRARDLSGFLRFDQQ